MNLMNQHTNYFLTFKERKFLSNNYYKTQHKYSNAYQVVILQYFYWNSAEIQRIIS